MKIQETGSLWIWICVDEPIITDGSESVSKGDVLIIIKDCIQSTYIVTLCRGHEIRVLWSAFSHDGVCMTRIV